MSAQPAHLTPEFIAQQRQRLEALRRQVLGGELSATGERRSFEENYGDEAMEFEDEAQDSAVEAEQALAGLDTELLGNGVVQVAVDVESLGLPARPIQREHQLAVERLAPRVQLDQGT